MTSNLEYAQGKLIIFKANHPDIDLSLIDGAMYFIQKDIDKFAGKYPCDNGCMDEHQGCRQDCEKLGKWFEDQEDA
jgi:hypothetical protein